MSKNLSKKEIDKFSRQIILKNIGPLGQKKILDSKVLIIGMGGLGCPAADFLTRSGIGKLGIVDHDIVSLSNIHRQSLYDEKDLNHSKVIIAKKKLNRINPKTKINLYNFKMDRVKFEKIIKDYDFIIDGTDNFESKFLINDLTPFPLKSYNSSTSKQSKLNKNLDLSLKILEVSIVLFAMLVYIISGRKSWESNILEIILASFTPLVEIGLSRSDVLFDQSDFA